MDKLEVMFIISLLVHSLYVLESLLAIVAFLYDFYPIMVYYLYILSVS